MKSCVVTKLLDVVNDPNIPVLGKLKCRFRVVDVGGDAAFTGANSIKADSSEGKALVTILDAGVTISSVSGAEMVDSKNAYMKNWDDTIYLDGVEIGDYVSVEINPKYNITSLGRVAGNFSLDELKYCTNLTVCSLQYTPDTNITGNIKELAGITIMEQLRSIYNNTYGDIKDIGSLVNLTVLEVASRSDQQHITGNWIDFVASQIDNGRTSCEGIVLYNTNYYYIGFGNLDGYPRAFGDESAVLKWEGMKVIFEKNADPVLRRYVYGYSDEEIQEMRDDGWLVFDCS